MGLQIYINLVEYLGEQAEKVIMNTQYRISAVVQHSNETYSTFVFKGESVDKNNWVKFTKDTRELTNWESVEKLNDVVLLFYELTD